MSVSSATIPRVTNSQRRIGTLAVCLGTLAMPFDSAVNVAFPAIVKAFHLAIPEIQWIVISYTLTYAALTLVCGRLGDILGHRPIFLAGCAGSVIAFVLCTVAPTYPLLLAARVLQGIGAALTLSCGAALLTALYDEAQRTRVLGLYTLVFGIGGGLGPLLGGFLVQVWDWPAVYAFRVPIAALSFVLGWYLPSSTRHAGGSFDLVGSVLLVAAIAALLSALNQLQHSDSTVTLLAVALVFVILAAGFVAHQRRSPHPVIDLAYFRDADFTLLNIGQIVANLAAFAIWLLVPFYLNRVAGLSDTAAGIMLAIAPFGTAVAAPVAGRFAATMSGKRLAMAGTLAIAIGGLLIGLGPGGVVVIGLAALMQGLGLGLYQVAYFDIATTTLPLEHRGVAGSLVMMTRTLGIVIGATVLTLAFQSLGQHATARGVDTDAAFLSGFTGAFLFAAALSSVIVAAAVLRGWASARPERA